MTGNESIYWDTHTCGAGRVRRGKKDCRRRKKKKERKEEAKRATTKPEKKEERRGRDKVGQRGLGGDGNMIL